MRDDARPAPFEPLARHDAVLHGEETEERRVDGHGGRQRLSRWAVERRRHGEVSDEPHRIEKRAQKDHVARDTVHKERNSFRHGRTSWYVVSGFSWKAAMGTLSRFD